MIQVIYNGGLGNMLFQYCFGRILAQTLGYRLDAKPIRGFEGTRDIIDGKDFSGPVEVVLRGQRPDLKLVDQARNANAKIVLTGYFQRYEYYEPYANEVRKWLHVSDPILDKVGKNDVVISMRRGRDYIPRFGLPLSYYEGALASTFYEDVHICTNEPDDPFVKYFVRKYGAKVRPGGFRGGKITDSYFEEALDNFCFIKKFNKIIISNSSFAWWASYLSNAEEIFFPRPATGMWAPNDPISRNMALEVNEPRYRYLPCEAYKSEFFVEKLGVCLDGAKRFAKPKIKRIVPFIGKTAKPAQGRYRFEED